MGLIARNPQEADNEQSAGQTFGGPPVHATGSVHLESVRADGSRVLHTQRFESGRLVEWTFDAEPAAWALVLPGEPTDRVRSGHADPSDVEAAGVRSGDELLALPPLDDLPHPGFDELEFVPDATARLRFELSGTPVGAILCDIHYLDGRRPWSRVVDRWSEESDGPASGAPLIEVGVSFANYLRMRTGEKTALEAIADGGSVGDTRWTLLLLLHGIVQRQPYVDIYRSLPVIPPEIGWWGEAAPFIDVDAAPG